VVEANRTASALGLPGADIPEASTSDESTAERRAKEYRPLSRDQHRSAVLLDVLAKHKRSDWERLLGITDIEVPALVLVHQRV
jgi:hypothetical protein